MHATMAIPLQFRRSKSLLALFVDGTHDDRRSLAIVTSSELSHAHNRSGRLTRAHFKSQTNISCHPLHTSVTSHADGLLQQIQIDCLVASTLRRIAGQLQTYGLP